MKTDRILSVAAMSLFGVSLLLPAATLDSGRSLTGTYLLSVGAFGLLYGEFRWLANCAFFAATIIAFLDKWRTGLGIGLAAIALGMGASCVIWPPAVVVGAGSYSTVHARLDVGAYFWIAAQVVVLLALVVKPRAERAA